MRALARVVWRRKELVLLPGIATAVVGGLVWGLVRAELWTGGSVALGAAGAVVIAAAATFGSAVTLLAADDALCGRPAGIGSCWTRAARRLPAIAGWMPVGALGVVGALLLVGMGWSSANYLVLPALVLDGAGMREARRNSRAAYRRDRGRFVRGSSRMTMPVQVALVPCLVAFGMGLTVRDRGLGALLTAGAALCLGAAVTVTASLYGVFRAALYRDSVVEAATEAVRPALRVTEVR
ncbi:hypothetical protein ACGF0D_24795 [Kitasatospora sp. NPDC048298]|uniref:hypothetical protein n=1 Tax=Kitasatospora sp. NPDC048298 TaxID=3364049 RepID=UPI0037179119